MDEKIKSGERLPEMEKMGEAVSLSDDSLDSVAGGGNGLTVDYYEDGYCPFCQCNHEVERCRERIVYVQYDYPTSYCHVKVRYFFEASNGYYDWNGNGLVGIY